MSFLNASSRRLAAIAATAASIGLASSALAGNGVSFELIVDGGAPQVFSPAGLDVGNGVFNYAQTEFGPGYTVGWDINAKGFDQPFISGNLVVSNQSLVTQTFQFTVNLPLSVAVLPASLMGGSVAGGLTTPVGGGTLAPLGNTPIWEAFIDGSSVASLLSSGASFTKGEAGSVAIGPEAFGQPIPSMPGPPIIDTMAITLSFSLTAGSQASFTSVFTAVLIPAPGAFALLGLAGFVGRGRRRN
jgi:hypothetical protein